MILYLDTSALIKLYAVEGGRALVERAVEEAGFVATSVVAYAEARAALARKRREGVFSAETYREAVQAFEDDWETFEKPEATEGVARAAGNLAEEHALRGFDAIHPAPDPLVRDAAASPQGSEGEAAERLLCLRCDYDLMKAAKNVMRTYESGE